MMNADFPIVNPSPKQARVLEWREIVARYQKPALWRSLWQILNTFVPYAVLWYVAFLGFQISFWLAIPPAILAGGFLVRVFIIFHDCGHGSFFKSRHANDILGFVSGVIAFSPYAQWRREHALHHATSGDLDRRGSGDVWTLTVREYLDASRWKRFSYRLVRNPFVLFVLAPLYMFLIKHRYPWSKAGPRERRSVYLTNLALAIQATAMIWLIGLEAYLLIQLTAIMVAGSAGIWLFYVQHQFEGVYWARREDWDYTDAALRGSSFYKLPRLLQWFTGNIGFHHIHHLSPRVPNYYLEKCHKADSIFQRVRPVTLFGSLRSFTYRLWDEQCQRLVGYGHLRAVRHNDKPPESK